MHGHPCAMVMMSLFKCSRKSQSILLVRNTSAIRLTQPNCSKWKKSELNDLNNATMSENHIGIPFLLKRFDHFNRESFVYRMMESGPCYLKIYGNDTNKMHLDGNSIDLDSTKLSLDRLKNVYQILRWDFFVFFFLLFFCTIDLNNWILTIAF